VNRREFAVLTLLYDPGLRLRQPGARRSLLRLIIAEPPLSDIEML
jgi:hypothetical protein